MRPKPRRNRANTRARWNNWVFANYGECESRAIECEKQSEKGLARTFFWCLSIVQFVQQKPGRLPWHLSTPIDSARRAASIYHATFPVWRFGFLIFELILNFGSNNFAPRWFGGYFCSTMVRRYSSAGNFAPRWFGGQFGAGNVAPRWFGGNVRRAILRDDSSAGSSARVILWHGSSADSSARVILRHGCSADSSADSSAVILRHGSSAEQFCATVVQENNVRRVYRYIQILPYFAENLQPETFIGKVGMYLQGGKIAFYRRVAARGGNNTQWVSDWESTGFIVGVGWAKGNALTPCLISRDEGRYRARVNNISDRVPFLPASYLNPHSKKLIWEDLGDDRVLEVW